MIDLKGWLVIIQQFYAYRNIPDRACDVNKTPMLSAKNAGNTAMHIHNKLTSIIFRYPIRSVI